MRVIKTYIVMCAAALMVACSAITQIGLPSPEAQIKAGADTISATTQTATRLLQTQSITVAQAQSYRAMLGSAAEALKDVNTDLVACRAATNSNEKTSPDPCYAKVKDVLVIALDNIAAMKRTLSAK
jgi:hypothetical protein